MAMAYLNGMNDNDNSQINGWFKDVVNKVEGAVKDAVNNVEATAKNVVTAVKNGLPVVAKIGLAPARVAFLGAVKINLLKLAKRLAQLYSSSPQAKQELQDLWVKKFKGDWSALRQAINQGANTSINGAKYKAGDIVGGQVLGTDGVWHDIKKGAQIGFSEAVLAAASPIIVAIIGLFSKHKSDKAGDTKDDLKAITDATNVLLDPNQNVATITTGADTKETPFYKNPIVLGVGAVALIGGIYMYSKRRK